MQDVSHDGALTAILRRSRLSFFDILAHYTRLDNFHSCEALNQGGCFPSCPVKRVFSWLAKLPGY